MTEQLYKHIDLREWKDAEFLLLLSNVDLARELRSECQENKLPLHHALFTGPSEGNNCEREHDSFRSFVQLLIRVHPMGLESVDKYGNLPIHLAAANPKINPTLVIELANHYPGGLEKENEDGRLPIHLVAMTERRQDRTPTLPELIGDLHVEGLKTVDNDGNLPIHLAAASSRVGANEVIKLAKRYPGGLHQENNEGCLPIHLAAMTCRSEHAALCWKLSDFYPEGLAHATKAGNLPVHELSRSRCKCTDAFEFFADANPEGLRHANSKGNLPIHEATSNADIYADGLNVLIHSYPEGLAHQCISGYTPLEKAIRLSLVGNVKRLAEHRPQDILVADKDGRNAITRYCETRLPTFMNTMLIQVFKIYSEHTTVLKSAEHAQLLSSKSHVQQATNVSENLKAAEKDIATYKNSIASKSRENSQLKELLKVSKEALQTAKKEIATQKRDITLKTEENRGLKGSLAATKKNLETVERRNDLIKGSLEIVQRMATKARASEQALYPLLETCDSIGTLRSVAQSLLARIDELRRPSGKRSMAQKFLAYLLNDPQASHASFLEAIDSLNGDLSDLEMDILDSVTRNNETDDESDDNENDHDEATVRPSSIFSSAPVKKRARVSLSPS